MSILPEDTNYHINIYICLKTKPGSGKDSFGFQWCKIDLTNTTVEVEENPIPKPKTKAKPKRMFLTPISSMPTTTPVGFRAIPHSLCNQKHKLVYAIGGCSAQKKDTYTGMVFEPASRSWKSCPNRFEKFWFHGLAIDCALVHTKNEFVLFNHVDQKHMVLDLTTGSWGSSFYTPIRFRTEHSSSSVAVGDVIYRVCHSKLYALDLAFKRPQFKRVYGLEKEIATIYRTAGIEYMVYLGKGKMCIVWGWSEPCDLHLEKDPYYDPIMYIACLKFWVGVCCQQNQLCAVVDRCEHYATQAHELYDCGPSLKSYRFDIFGKLGLSTIKGKAGLNLSWDQLARGRRYPTHVGLSAQVVWPIVGPGSAGSFRYGRPQENNESAFRPRLKTSILLELRSDPHSHHNLLKLKESRARVYDATKTNYALTFSFYLRRVDRRIAGIQVVILLPDMDCTFSEQFSSIKTYPRSDATRPYTTTAGGGGGRQGQVDVDRATNEEEEGLERGQR
ncbi:hypothetical protein LguiA_021184 [Lonicera macranthoides]